MTPTSRLFLIVGIAFQFLSYSFFFPSPWDASQSSLSGAHQLRNHEQSKRQGNGKKASLVPIHSSSPSTFVTTIICLTRTPHLVVLLQNSVPEATWELPELTCLKPGETSTLVTVLNARTERKHMIPIRERCPEICLI